MASIGQYKNEDLVKENKIFSAIRTTVETAFYSNTVKHITNRTEAYELAKHAQGAVVTDLPIYQAEEQGLPADAKVIVFNDGGIVGRTAAARKIIGQPGVNEGALAKLVREAAYGMQRKNTLTADVLVGLDTKYTVKSHLLVPEGYETNVLSYMLNFQEITAEYAEMYAESQPYPVGDLFVMADPDWTSTEYPDGLALFDPVHNTAVILGLRYFGELKKGTLTLAWAAAHRNGFVACHGGMKQYTLPDGSKYTMAAFGLSGSGKSTITLAKNPDKYDVTVLHDDAFVIGEDDGSTTALEPAYFDKAQDYPMTSDAVKYFLTCQNVGVSINDRGEKVLVTEDIRNGNGRTVKSRFFAPNRVDHLQEKIDAVYWIMKDDTLPPLVRVDDPALASIFGLTLATKRSSAENIVGKVDMDALVIEPFANPFRAYALGEDYRDFKHLFETMQADCYILNTGFFGATKVKPKHTLGSIEAVVDKDAEFEPFGPIAGLSYLPVAGFDLDFTDVTYLTQLKARMQNRLDFIMAKKTELDGYHALPEGTEEAVQRILVALDDAIAANS
ncbi:phosphoenolpyruvate carboxykinase (ATP) [Periweissella cryptocerci]|uniref:phosphoenolpyruvate carboxykinase (ATP) n=1 Tax=Periweissella cryptocerci TaxID=2506420 RepID=A0A4V1AIR8_9LACO|nr:phosphoenolpyruvate carboxykinase (ATP) [Periweissella cryptocerci]QBO36455.1 phosphoenolpyruvate carboxykinase (ATP) [Periweissella cryptocerci]